MIHISFEKWLVNLARAGINTDVTYDDYQEQCKKDEKNWDLWIETWVF